MSKPKQLSPYGIWLKQKREAKNWSVRNLADRAGGIVSGSRISQIENNSYPGKKGKPTIPEVEIVDALAQALGESVNEAREKAGYPKTDEEMSETEVIKEFTYVVSKYKNLTPRARELVNRHFTETIDFLLETQTLTLEQKMPVEEGGKKSQNKIKFLRETEPKKVKK